MLYPTCSSSGDHKCSVGNAFVAETEPATDAVVCHQNKRSLRFIVPLKHKSRNEGLMCDQRNTETNVSRPVIMPFVIRTLSRTQSLSDKCSNASSSSKLPDLHCIYSTDKSSTDEQWRLSHEGQSFVVKSCEPNCISLSEVKESPVIDTVNDCIIKNDSLETSLTVNVKDVLHAPQQQQAHPDNIAIISHSSDVNKHSSLSYLSEKVFETLEQPTELSCTKDNVRTQRLVCKDSQLKRIANKGKGMSSKASPGSLLMSRIRVDSSRFSLKDAVGGTRPHTYSLLEVAFKIADNIIMYGN